MIFWFSGTGNSFAVAQALARGLGDRMMPISRALEYYPDGTIPTLGADEPIGFVFPVYAWGPPDVVLEFVKKLRLPEQAAEKAPYVFSVSTCGDEEGHATPKLQKALKTVGLTLDSAFTLQMPNNYVLGFDIDSPEVQSQKLLHVEERLQKILPILATRQKGVFQLIPGKAPGFKTGFINVMFKRFAMNASRFSASLECTKCGLCEELCPTRNIVRKEGRPIWGNRCTQCLACLHHCPVRAIQYGKNTERKGRYVHPDAKGMRSAMNERFD